jgi:hypothetical protein
MTPKQNLKEIVIHQANMEGLWPMHPTIQEHLLISALRHLHAVIEGDEEMADLYKPEYWYLESEL